MEELLKFLKCISEETRFKILKTLLDQRLCVCELTDILDRSQPCISQHLKKFKELELVIEEREEQWAYYKIDLSVYQKYMKMLSDLMNLSFESLGLEQLKQDLEEVQADKLCCRDTNNTKG